MDQQQFGYCRCRYVVWGYNWGCSRYRNYLLCFTLGMYGNNSCDREPFAFNNSRPIECMRGVEHFDDRWHAGRHMEREQYECDYRLYYGYRGGCERRDICNNIYFANRVLYYQDCDSKQFRRANQRNTGDMPEYYQYVDRYNTRWHMDFVVDRCRYDRFIIRCCGRDSSGDNYHYLFYRIGMYYYCGGDGESAAHDCGDYGHEQRSAACDRRLFRREHCGLDLRLDGAGGRVVHRRDGQLHRGHLCLDQRECLGD